MTRTRATITTAALALSALVALGGPALARLPDPAPADTVYPMAPALVPVAATSDTGLGWHYGVGLVVLAAVLIWAITVVASRLRSGE